MLHHCISRDIICWLLHLLLNHLLLVCVLNCSIATRKNQGHERNVGKLCAGPRKTAIFCWCQNVGGIRGTRGLNPISGGLTLDEIMGRLEDQPSSYFRFLDHDILIKVNLLLQVAQMAFSSDLV